MYAPRAFRSLIAAAAVFAGLNHAEAAEPASGAPAVKVAHKTVKVGDVDIFYREAGPKDAPAVLLLHGFPTSSQMFRNLIPQLAGKYRVVAPDYPGYGHSSMPPRESFAYTFDNLAKVIDAFTEQIELKSYCAVRAGLRSTGRLPAGERSSGTRHGDRRAKRQRL
ncbi:MAG: alpha/beta fold hydrolase [Pirellulales bacterium]